VIGGATEFNVGLVSHIVTAIMPMINVQRAIAILNVNKFIIFFLKRIVKLSYYTMQPPFHYSEDVFQKGSFMGHNISLN
jgi:hypothetical protein